MKLPYKLLIYDIETSLLLAWLFGLGENVIRHNQLLEAFEMYDILTISCKWYGEKKIYLFEGPDAIEEFDKLARTADVIIGKNNSRFDDKRLNTDRLIKGKKPFTEFKYMSEDLESQIRKNFAFPSYSLDALSKFFGFGGKKKMEFDDWKIIAKYKLLLKFKDKLGQNYNVAVGNTFTSILFNTSLQQVIKEGKLKLKKMGSYNGKDVLDTERLLKKVLPYVNLKHNAATRNEGKGCTTCGSTNIAPTKILFQGKTKYQLFTCLSHNGYAGRATVTYDKHRNKRFGKIG